MQGAWVTVPAGRKRFSIADNGRILSVHWGQSETDAWSNFTASQLHHHSYATNRLANLAAARRAIPLSDRGTGVAKLDYDTVMQSQAGVHSWLETLARDGLCVIDLSLIHI